MPFSFMRSPRRLSAPPTAGFVASPMDPMALMITVADVAKALKRPRLRSDSQE